jgi:hypothetical protein
MDPFTRWLIGLERAYRSRPNPRRLAIMLAVVMISLAIAGYERAFGWPDWLTTEPVPIRGR